MKILLLLLLVVCFNLTAMEPFYAAVRKSTAPVLDGKLDDKCWKGVESTSAFVQVNGKSVPVKTTAQIFINGNTLYVGFSCGEPAGTDLKALIRENALPSFEDSIELFLEPERGSTKYYQFMFSVTGKKYTGIGNARKVDLDKCWSGVVFIKPKGWSAELKIPLAKFGIKPDVATRCGLNLTRTCVFSKKRYSCWSPTYGGFHAPAKFGNLIFFSYSSWLKSRLAVKTEHFKSNVMRLKEKYPESMKLLMPKVVQLLEKSNKIINNLKKRNFEKIYSESAQLEKTFSEMLTKIRLTIINNEYEK